MPDSGDRPADLSPTEAVAWALNPNRRPVPTLSQPGSPEFQATVDKMRKEYEKLSDAKLAKKIRHLTRAAGRCRLYRNVQLMFAFRQAAIEIAVARLKEQKANERSARA